MHQMLHEKTSRFHKQMFNPKKNMLMGNGEMFYLKNHPLKHAAFVETYCQFTEIHVTGILLGGHVEVTVTFFGNSTISDRSR